MSCPEWRRVSQCVVVLTEHVRQLLKEQCGLVRAFCHAVLLTHVLVDDVDHVDVAKDWGGIASGCRSVRDLEWCRPHDQ